MKRILIISPMYTQMQHLKQIVNLQSELYQICGTADNSVLGMSMIESTKPDLVLMPAYMLFWNAEDLVNYLLPRGICPTFVLLNDAACTIDPSAMAKVAKIIPSMMPSPDQLLEALGNASFHVCSIPVAKNEENGAVQHSLEVMELLMALNPIDTREAQQKFGRLRIGKKACWIILGAPPDGDGPPFFRQIEQLEEPFCAIPGLLSPLGACEVCIYREKYLCILLAEGQYREPEWTHWCGVLNQLLSRYSIPPMVYEISDMPLPMEYWYSQCRELLQLRQKRFFLSPPFLQPKILAQYKTFVTQAQLHAKLSTLSQAIHGLRPSAVEESLDELESLLSHSLSMELYSYAMTQMAVQYSNFKTSLSLSPSADDHDLFFPDSSQTLHQVLASYRKRILNLMGQAGSVSGCSNPIIRDVCGFISSNLSEQLTLETVANHVHINPTYLSRLFKKEAGISFSSYINRARITRAMQLMEVDHRIADVSGMVGYENPKYFSHVFKRVTGETPQQYRNRHRKGTKL